MYEYDDGPDAATGESGYERVHVIGPGLAAFVVGTFLAGLGTEIFFALHFLGLVFGAR